MEEIAGDGAKVLTRSQSKVGRRVLISVIIATYNVSQTLEKAINSVLGNSYKDINLLIIDGGSQDGTVDIIRKYDHNLAYWESTPDEGIYHALNKGLGHAAEGSYVLVLGADDRLLCLAEVVETINRCDPDVVIANVRQRDIKSDSVRPYRCYLPIKVDESNFLKFPFHHQGFLFRKPHEALSYFDSSLGLHADYEFMARLINSGASAKYVSCELAEYATGGASDYISFKNVRSFTAVARRLGLSLLKILISNPIAALSIIFKMAAGKAGIRVVRELKVAFRDR